MKQNYQMKSGAEKIQDITQKSNGKLSKKMLKRKIGNYCIQKTEPIKLKKRNCMKTPTQVKLRSS